MFPVFYGNIDLVEHCCQFKLMQGTALEITFYPYFTILSIFYSFYIAFRRRLAKDQT